MSDYETMCFGDFVEDFIVDNGGSDGVNVELTFEYKSNKITSITVIDKEVDEDGLDDMGRPYLAYFRLIEPSENLTFDTMGEVETL